MLIFSLQPHFSQQFISRIFLSGVFLVIPYRISLKYDSVIFSVVSLLILTSWAFSVSFISPSFLVFIHWSRSILDQAHILHVFHVSVTFIRSYLTFRSQPNFPVPFSLVSDDILLSFTCQTHFGAHFFGLVLSLVADSGLHVFASLVI